MLHKSLFRGKKLEKISVTEVTFFQKKTPLHVEFFLSIMNTIRFFQKPEIANG
jgi:hypothetical protein